MIPLAYHIIVFHNPVGSVFQSLFMNIYYIFEISECLYFLANQQVIKLN